MKGKRLFELMTSLSKSERRQLHFLCASSQDKRHSYLKLCLDAHSLETFQYQLDEVRINFRHLAKDKQEVALNRFIYFSRKEIEDLKIKNYLANDSRQRNRMLLEIAYQEKHHDLFKYYSKVLDKKSVAGINVIEDLRLIYLEISQHLRIQKGEDYQGLKILLPKKRKKLEALYRIEMTNFYILLSSLCMDDLNVREEMGEHIPSAAIIQKMMEEADSPAIAGVLKISEARFNFFELKKLQKNIAEAEEIFRFHAKEDKRCQLFLRTAISLKVLMGIHYGFPLKQLMEWGREAFNLFEQFKFYESVGYFYFLLFLILNGEFEEYEKISSARNASYFNKETRFYIDFLNGLLHFINTEYDESIDFLNNLAYSDNHCIALWSRLLEIKIHLELENMTLFESLLNRIKRLMEKNSHRPFANHSALAVVRVFSDTLKSKKLNASLADSHFSLFHLVTK